MAPKKKILIVEDNEGLRKTFLSLIELQGWEGIGVASVAEAQGEGVLANNDVDVVVTDWALGPMEQERSGVGLIKWMHSREQYRHIPTVLMSGDLTQWAIDEAKATAIYRKDGSENAPQNFLASIKRVLQSQNVGANARITDRSDR